MAAARNALLLGSLLKNTSRSFYLTLRVLPREIRNQIGLAYLLARTSDTIADTRLIPPEQRLEALRALGERIKGSRRGLLDFRELARHQGSEAEQTLLEQCEGSLALLQNLEAEDQKLVREVLGTIISGQELDLQRFGGAGADRIVALRRDEELEDYTYRVAGCVGEFWTRMCFAHVYRDGPAKAESLLPDSVRFGKGLQLVNILRDVAADLRQGRCYLPEEGLSGIGLKPGDLLKPEKEGRLRPLYNIYLDRAQENLLAGWRYTNALPRRSIRVRLACAWPILIGLETIAKLRTGKVLEPQQRIKVSRAEVRRIMVRSVVCYPWGKAWNKQIRSAGGSTKFPTK